MPSSGCPFSQLSVIPSNSSGCPFSKHWNKSDNKSDHNSYNNNNKVLDSVEKLKSSEPVGVLNSIPVIDFLPDGILIVEEGGTIIECNNAAERMFGYTRAEFLTLEGGIHSLVPPQYRSRHSSYTKLVFDSMEAREMAQRRPVKAYHKNGGEFEVSIHLSPNYLRTHSVQTCRTDSVLVETTQLRKIVTCVCRDMTSHNSMIREKNQAEQRTASMESFLRLVNHEVRTGMHGIINALSTVKEEMLSYLKATGATIDPSWLRDEDDPSTTPYRCSPLPKLRSIFNDQNFLHVRVPDNNGSVSPKSTVRSITMLEAGVTSMEVLFRNMLDYRSLMDNTYVQHVVAFDIGNFFRQLQSNHASRFLAKGQQVKLDIPEDMPLVECDATLLTKVIECLFDNAIKHSGERTTIMLRCQEVLHDQAQSANLPLQDQHLRYHDIGESFMDSSNVIFDMSMNPGSTDTSSISSSIGTPTSETAQEFKHIYICRSSSDGSVLTRPSYQETQPNPNIKFSRSAPVTPYYQTSFSSQLLPRHPSYISYILNSSSSSSSFPPPPSSEDPTRYFLLSIMDDGVGMSPEVFRRLENETFDMDASSTRATNGGLGIGLRIAKLCAQKLNAHIGLKSRSGGGGGHSSPTDVHRSSSDLAWSTALFLTIPLKVVQSSSPSALQRNRLRSFRSLSDPIVQKQHIVKMMSADSTSQRASFRILVVEDNLVNVKVLLGILSKHGFKSLKTCKNGQEAVDVIEKMHQDKSYIDASHGDDDAWLPFDLILMDCEMPVMDGWKATQRIRELGCLSPIFALTADATASSQQKCMKVGMDVYMNKPLHAPALMFAIAALKPFSLYSLEYCPHVLIPSAVVSTMDSEQP